jgi:phenylalanyl-tRNA synthetase alpha subunit
MSSVESLRSQQSRKQAELQKQKENKAVMERQISRLKEAKKQVLDEQEEISRIFSDVKKQEKKYTEWKGKENTWFNSFISGQFQTNSKNYSSKLQQVYNRICDKITQLENKCIDTGGLISSIMRTINSIGNEIDKLINNLKY